MGATSDDKFPLQEHRADPALRAALERLDAVRPRELRRNMMGGVSTNGQNTGCYLIWFRL